MEATLENLASGERHEVRDIALMGRVAESNVRLEDRSASRRHAMIREQDDGFFFYDLGSVNGSYINGVRATTTRKLRSGDVIRIVDTEFRFQSTDDPPTAVDNMVFATTVPVVRKMPMILLVSDIFGYTLLSEKLAPEDLAQIIGSWYNNYVQILGSYGASIDKFLGDAVLAYWTATSVEAHETSLRAAYDLLKSCERIREKHSSTLAKAGLEFRAGVALHYGEVTSRPVSKSRGESTFVGDAVNVTFRVEELTRSFDRNILTTGDFLEGWPEGAALCQSQGRQRLHGRTGAVEIFSVESPPAA